MPNDKDELRYCEEFCPIFDAVESWNNSLYKRSYIFCPEEMCTEMVRVYTENKAYWENKKRGDEDDE